MSSATTRAYFDYHYPPPPAACWVGNQHIWTDTGVTRQVWTSDSTEVAPPEGIPKEHQQRCFCEETRWEIRWVTHIPTGNFSV